MRGEDVTEEESRKEEKGENADQKRGLREKKADPYSKPRKSIRKKLHDPESSKEDFCREKKEERSQEEGH